MTVRLNRVLALTTGMGLLMTTPLALAQVGNAYIGGGVGVANFEDNVEFRDLGDVDIDDDSTAYKLFGGYRATEHFAIEGGYRNFGEADAGPFSVETDGFDLSALAFLPVGPIELFARGGGILYETDVGGGFPDDDGEAFMYGLGGQLNVGNLWFRIESEWFEMDVPDDTQMISASVGWNFR